MPTRQDTCPNQLCIRRRTTLLLGGLPAFDLGNSAQEGAASNIKQHSSQKGQDQRHNHKVDLIVARASHQTNLLVLLVDHISIIMSGASSSPTGGSSGGNTAGAKNLQERLHQLLTRLSATIELIKNWPTTDGDDASIHVETTTKLIAAVLEVIVALQRAEGVVKADNDLRKSLQDCPVPINLLDLLDHGNGLNPGTFVEGGSPTTQEMIYC
jgi:hypothetical protein